VVRIVFAEGGDSFSWNVVGALPFPRRDVEIVPAPSLVADPSRLDGADALVVGPGPTDPERAGLVRLVREAAWRRLPTLGICLGHQAIGAAFGANVRRVPPVHGRTAVVRFVPSRLFPGFEGDLRAMRYHSLALDGVGAPLRNTDGTAAYAINASAPIYQISRDRLEADWGPRLVKVARDIRTGMAAPAATGTAPSHGPAVRPATNGSGNGNGARPPMAAMARR